MDAIENSLEQVNEVELVYRSRCCQQRPQISTSGDADRVLRPYYDRLMDTRELFYLLLLDRGNKAKGVYLVSCGGLHGTVVDPKLVFSAALKTLACALVLSHNHPSGQLRPSTEDLALTRKLVEAGKFLDIQVFDHVILTREGFYSFADNGVL